MPKIVITQYSRYFDVATGVQFDPVLEMRCGCFVGVAETDDRTARSFAGRASFQILDEQAYRERMRPEEQGRSPLVRAATGDPLREGAPGTAEPPEPPHPPESKRL